MSFDLTHARHDPAHCLAPGLFRSLRRGERKRSKLDVTYKYGTDSIRFWGPEPLGADDLRVLQGLVALAAVCGPNGKGIILKPETQSEIGSQLRLMLDLQWDAIEKNARVVQGSYRALAHEIGYKEGGDQFQTIRKSIERMWAVSIIVERNGKRQGFKILSDYASDECTGRIFVALNPRISDAICGDHAHTRIDFSEVRKLQSDPARLIHQRLCGWIGQGQSKKVGIDTLCGYAWPNEAKPEAMKKRRQTTRKAISEIAALGWKINEYAVGKFVMGRPNPPCDNVPQTL